MRSVLKDGTPHRFCQQCGRFHPLSDFDGERRSCRTMLQRHCHRRAKQKQEFADVLAQRVAEKEAAAVIVAAAASGTLGMPGGLPLQQLQYLAGGLPGGVSAGGGELHGMRSRRGANEQLGAAGDALGHHNHQHVKGEALLQAGLASAGVAAEQGMGGRHAHSPPGRQQLLEAVQAAPGNRQQDLLGGGASGDAPVGQTRREPGPGSMELLLASELPSLQLAALVAEQAERDEAAGHDAGDSGSEGDGHPPKRLRLATSSNGGDAPPQVADDSATPDAAKQQHIVERLEPLEVAPQQHCGELAGHAAPTPDAAAAADSGAQ